MTDKEAIEIIRKIKKDNESKSMIICNNTSNIQIRWSNKDLKEMAEITNRCAKENRAIETVLNLLEEKDKESHFIQNELEFAKAKIIKLKKIIDLMAYDIATNDSDLCQYIDETRRCKKYAGENKLTCDECIKQYFERKVENGN